MFGQANSDSIKHSEPFIFLVELLAAIFNLAAILDFSKMGPFLNMFKYLNYHFSK